MKNSPLLTIAIPTYNRASYLDKLLSSLLSQSGEFSNSIEIVICDNHSTDNTEETCNKYLAINNDIRYVRNDENIGMDGNFEKCFSLANGRYYWMIGDDDVLRPNALRTVLTILAKDNNYDLIYVNSSDEIISDKQDVISFDEYNNGADFINRVGVMFTFISGMICNKHNYLRIAEETRVSFVSGTYLLHLFWQLPLVKSGKCFGYINNNLVQSTSDNSGGYGLFTVFGKNLASIIDLFYPRTHFVSQSLRKSAAKFLLNFLQNDKKTNAFTVSNYLADADAAFYDLTLYKMVLRFLYRNPGFSYWIINFRKSLKKFLIK
ncbi:glycosyltransferase family 2 protein [Kosakonia radicincitans]|uniref:glycosyltransferase family 2 protein n=1 Tax=Kosakonia radicincitans TaxID=283686 RepID=UPI0005C30A8F|nr:glycosyltransferase family 2 protein [Kosakonia radicincitans]KIS42941.1 glycosyltransferase like 2 family protein [Kosakonia radicincitans YD4]